MADMAMADRGNIKQAIKAIAFNMFFISSPFFHLNWLKAEDNALFAMMRSAGFPGSPYQGASGEDTPSSPLPHSAVHHLLNFVFCILRPFRLLRKGLLF
jgi:hypothetical protein